METSFVGLPEPQKLPVPVPAIRPQLVYPAILLCPLSKACPQAQLVDLFGPCGPQGQPQHTSRQKHATEDHPEARAQARA
ncbi:GL17253 [Drosophila persimilis]|uniref:GL17253 n=1 Tax=Drosophila persimilis TaxID=7234 RepID=B4GIR5_DROPE|nr:GL17253 [Drosophila persimilis]